MNKYKKGDLEEKPLSPHPDVSKNVEYFLNIDLKSLIIRKNDLNKEIDFEAYKKELEFKIQDIKDDVVTEYKYIQFIWPENGSRNVTTLSFHQPHKVFVEELRFILNRAYTLNLVAKKPIAKEMKFGDKIK